MNEEKENLSMSIAYSNDNDFKEAIEALNNNTLTDLAVGKSGAGAVAKIAAAVRNNDSLQVLRFDEDTIEENDAKAIAKALRHNKTLLDLTFSACKIDEKEVVVIFDSLSKNNTLRRLSFDFNTQMSPSAVEHVATFLKNNTPLNKLSLTLDGVEQIKILAQGLKQNNILSELSLAHSAIDNEGAKAIAEALEENKGLKNLTLGVNEIGDEGAIAIAKALEKNRTLVTLSLNTNKIGASGGEALAKAYKANETLKELNLIGNEKVQAEDASTTWSPKR